MVDNSPAAPPVAGPASTPGSDAASGDAASSGINRKVLRSFDSAVIWLWLIAVAAAAVRWWPLVSGEGLVGGDLYTYFFPLKAWYAERLRQGELALWNPLIGNGMPSLAESQTAVFYPPNLLLYGLLPVGVAYNASFLLHYVLAIGFTGHYLRRLGLGLGATLFGSVVFVYGWFPARSCLEWAIVTGAWLPLVLWGVEGFLAGGRPRHAITIALALGMQLLAGHFNLAFITLLVVAIYAPLRWATLTGDGVRRSGRLVAVAIFVCLGLGVAAVQLVPTWELKSRSQRRGTGERSHDVSYGSVPAWYLPQAVLPWAYYPDVATGFLPQRLGASNTNQVEAHLYFGMLPLVLAVVAIIAARRESLVWIWFVVALTGLMLVPGWWSTSMGRLPGFSFFTGPGRYGVMAQLAIAVLAAFSLQRLLSRIQPAAARGIVVFAALAFSWLDLQWASRAVEYARPVPAPPIALRASSSVARLLKPTDRVLSVNQNSVTLTGAAMLPVYLGLGPAEYFAAPTRLPDAFQWNRPLSDEVAEWLRQAGVTHVLALEPHPDWPCDLVWSGVDPLLHRLLGRGPHEPIFLYRLAGALGRAYWLPSTGSAEEASGSRPRDRREIVDVVVRANRVTVRVNSAAAGRVVLTDLDYPGWRVIVDGHTTTGKRAGGMFRSVPVGPGSHTVEWRYLPTSAIWGGIISVLSVLAAVVASRMWFKGRSTRAEQ